MGLRRLIAKTQIAPSKKCAEERLIEMKSEPGYVSAYIAGFDMDKSFSVVGLYDHGSALPGPHKEVFVHEETFFVRIWPDDTWCYEEEYNEHDYSHMSDDYNIKEFGGDWTYDEVDIHVQELNRGLPEKFRSTDK